MKTDLLHPLGMNNDKVATLMNDNVVAIKQAFSELPSYHLVVEAVLEYGMDNINEHCQLKPGVPVKPMLAKPTNGVKVKNFCIY
jgi:DNA ligase-1